MDGNARAKTPKASSTANRRSQDTAEVQLRYTDGGNSCELPPGLLMSSWKILKDVVMNIVAQGEDGSEPGPCLVKFTLQVPELQLRRPIGGCCELPPELLIEEALREVERVCEVVVANDDGLVHVWTTDDDPGLLEELTDRVEGLGYRVAEASIPPS